MGICTSTGIIRDFAGPYFVSVSDAEAAWLFSERTRTQKPTWFSAPSQRKSKWADFTAHASHLIGQKLGLTELPEDPQKLVV